MAAALADCSAVLNASFNASFKTRRLFYEEKGEVPWQQIEVFFFCLFVSALWARRMRTEFDLVNCLVSVSDQGEISL